MSDPQGIAKARVWGGVIRLMGQVYTSRHGNRPGGVCPQPQSLRVASLHYPGEGLHWITRPQQSDLVRLPTPEGEQLPLIYCQCGHGSVCGLDGGQRNRDDYNSTHDPTSEGGGEGRLSLGPVLLYADIFLARCTDLPDLESAFRSAYPTDRPPIRLARENLLAHYVLNIYPITMDKPKHSIGLFSDLIDHGMGRLADTLALAAQDRSYQSVTGQPASPAQRQRLVDRIRSLCKSPHRPARTAGRVEPGRHEVTT